MNTTIIKAYPECIDNDIPFNLQINNPLTIHKYPAFKVNRKILINKYPDNSVALWVTKLIYKRCSCHKVRTTPSIDVACQKTWKIFYTFCPYCGDYYEPDLHK